VKAGPRSEARSQNTSLAGSHREVFAKAETSISNFIAEMKDEGFGPVVVAAALARIHMAELSLDSTSKGLKHDKH
jgi:hypothetical protein